MFVEDLRHLANFLFAGKKNEDVALLQARQFIHGRGDGVGHRLIERVLLRPRFQRPIERFDRIGSAGHLDDRSVAKMPAEALRIDRGRGDDQFQIGPRGRIRLS